jgi:hypothetical protein
MKKLILLNVIFLYLFSVNLLGFHIDGSHTANYAEQQKEMLVAGADKFFVDGTLLPFSNEFVAVNPFCLMQAAQDTLNFIQENAKKSRCIIIPPHLSHVLNLKNVEKTLKFIISIIKQDMPSGKFRILNPNFLNENFNFIKWNADRNGALDNGINLPYGGMIRLTNYAIFSVPGSYKKIGQYQCALYQIFDNHICKKYSKQQVLAGILNQPPNKSKVRPMVWLTRQDFEDALMQGTVIVKMPDGKERLFVANQCNGIDYDKSNKDPWLQKRYWYFKEDKSSKWSVIQFKKRLSSRQNVVFAGDIFNIGLGKVIALKHINPYTQKPEIRLGVIADTGGAFVRNLYQLDLFAGIFQNKQDFTNYIKHLPVRTEAYILYR